MDSAYNNKNIEDYAIHALRIICDVRPIRDESHVNLTQPVLCLQRLRLFSERAAWGLSWTLHRDASIGVSIRVASRRLVRGSLMVLRKTEKITDKKRCKQNESNEHHLISIGMIGNLNIPRRYS